MKTLALTLFAVLTISTVSMAAPGRTTSGAHRPATAVSYQMAAYPSADAAYLYVSVDKQAGGRVNIRLRDKAGAVFFEQTLTRKQVKVRLKLNVAELKDGAYQLEVTNGIKTTVRDMIIATNEPMQAFRTVALL